MLGLILAGGLGSRYGNGEKPLALCAGRPMIDRVATALDDAGLDIVVVAAPCAPFTQNWCRAHDLLCICTAGEGYIADLAEAAALLGIMGPVLTVAADLPCISADIVERIVTAYHEQALPALSVWVPIGDAESVDAPCIEVIDGCRAVPAGINILEGSRIGDTQEEMRLVLDDPCLRYNVNTPGMLEAAEAYLDAAEKPRTPGENHRKKDIDCDAR